MQTNEEYDWMVDYFRAHPRYFWRWGDGGRVIEYQDGTTICFRQEFEACLEAIKDESMPQMLTLVLLIAASRDNFKDAGIVAGGWDAVFADRQNKLDIHEQSCIDFLVRINELPKALRSGEYLHHLVRLVHQHDEDRPWEYYMPDLVASLKRGELDSRILAVSSFSDRGEIQEVSNVLHEAAVKFPTLESLQNALQTGLPEPPKPAEVPIPEVQQPEENASPFLELLLEDPRTVGLAHLARHLMAALNIPMQARGTGELPLGGVSDITNRGNYDRLLLSELANDDLTLMARLSNNEALFLRREEPPVKIEKERIVLIDTTIRLWGMTRAFAISAALACKERTPAGRAFSAYLLGGGPYAHANLDTLKGVVASLSMLQPSLHAAEGLANCLKALPKGDHELIFITAAEVLADPAFAQLLAPQLPKLNYIVTVASDGGMQLIEVMRGQRKLLTEARFDLRDLLFRRPKKPKGEAQQYGNKELPAFCNLRGAPLYFPAPALRLRGHNTKIISYYSILVVTDNLRLLYWPRADRGGIEVTVQVPHGQGLRMHLFQGQYVVLTMSKTVGSKLGVDIFDLRDHQEWHLELHCETWQNVYFSMPFLYYTRLIPGTYQRELVQLNFLTGEEELSGLDPNSMPDKLVGGSQQGTYSLHDLKKVVNPGYSTLQRIKYFRVYDDGRIDFDARSLVVSHLDRLEIRSAAAAVGGLSVRVEERSGGIPIPGSELIALFRVEWKDGSVGFLDPRGFVHLRSSDPALPEITVVLVIDMETTAWASNGVYTGSPFFVAAQSNYNHIPPSEFQRLYLKPFTQRILSTP